MSDQSRTDRSGDGAHAPEPAGLKRLTARGPVSPEAVRLFATVRDERIRLPWFLSYYRAMGVERFFVVDNGSADGTTELLAEQDDVDLFHTHESYAASRCGITWLNGLLDRYALDHWSLVVDADELFVYPSCETLPLEGLLAYLDGKGYDAMTATLVDMYSDRPIEKAGYRPGTSFLEACPFFDAEGYDFDRQNDLHPLLPRFGGARRRLFWNAGKYDFPPPFLPKVPLVKWRQGFSFESGTHVLSGGRLSRESGALLHFKLLDDFGRRASTEAVRKEHFCEAREYAAYSEAMVRDQQLSAYFEGSVRYGLA
jgi:hypothetical protein